MDNKRRTVRVSATLKVLFHEVESDFLSGSCGKNISETGLCIPLTHIPSGSFLEVEIQSDGLKPSVKATARIAWIANRTGDKFPFEAGLELVNLGPVDRAALHSYIARCSAPGEAPDIRWID